MPRRIQFGGQSIRIPGAYSQVDATAMTPAVLGAFSTVGVIGQSTGGIPKRIVTYTQPSAAELDLVSGTLLNSMKLMWSPGGEATGASEILACRVDNATQSTLDLYDTLTGLDQNNPVIRLTSRNFGKFTEQIKVMLSEASDGYGKKIEIWNAGDLTAVPETNFNGLGMAFTLVRHNTDGAIVYDVRIANIAEETLEVDEFSTVGGNYIFLEAPTDYTAKLIPGEQITVTLAAQALNNQNFTIISSSVVATRTKVKVVETVITEAAGSPAKMTLNPVHWMKVWVDDPSHAASPELNFDFGNQLYDQVVKIVDYIQNNFSSVYTVKIVGDSQTSRFLPSIGLDSKFGQGILTIAAGSTSPRFEATGYVALVSRWVNANSNLTSAAVLAAAGTLPLWEFSEEQALSGGTNGNLTPTDWSDAISLYEAHDVQLMVIASESLDIQLQGKQHIEYMSTQGRSERRGYFGHPVGKTIPEIKDWALALSSKRTMLLSPGVAWTVNEDGDPEIEGSMMAASLVCGMVAGSPPQTPLTNKQLNILDIEKAYLDSEIIELLDAGVAPIRYDRTRGIFKIVQGQTTWLRDDNTLYKEDSVGRIADYISLNVRRRLEDKFVGTAADRGTAEDIRIEVTGMLGELLKAKIITNYGTVKVRIEDTIAYVEYEVAPSSPINFILITTKFIPSRLVA